MWRLRLYLKNFLPGIYILSLIVFLICSMNTSVYSQINPEISALLSQQQKLWNKGDIPGFMEFYKKDDNTSFVSSKGVNYGWNQILDRYKMAYPDKESMGNLEFKVIEFKALGESNYLVLGQYILRYDDDEASGYFSLVWERHQDQWRIISDHTSASVKKN